MSRPLQSATSRAHPARALLALGVGGFSIGTGEFVIMGLLPDVARDLGVSIPAAGRLISAYALGVMVGAPVIAMLASRWPRRKLLMALMTCYALANFATTLAPGDLGVALMRFASGLPHGAYFGVAALVAASLAPPDQRARAVGFVMLGLTTATLAGVPLAAWLGQQFGWRAAFAFVGAVAVVAVVLIRAAIPELPADAGASPMSELGALAQPQVWLTLAIAGIGFGGMFCVFSYIKPILTDVTGLGVATVPLVLSLFGLGGVAGNLLGSRLADRALMPTIGGTLIYSALLLACFGLLARHAATAMLGVFLLGTLVSLGPGLQIRLMDVAGKAQTMAAALNHSAFNFANGLGALLGGSAIARGWDLGSLGWLGSCLALGGLLIWFVALLADRARTFMRRPGSSQLN